MASYLAWELGRGMDTTGDLLLNSLICLCGILMVRIADWHYLQNTDGCVYSSYTRRWCQLDRPAPGMSRKDAGFPLTIERPNDR